jgi:hypothetical protein
VPLFLCLNVGQLRAKEVQLKAATAQRQQQLQRGPFADMDAAAIEARLSAQVEEANQRAQAASSARNVAEQRAKDAKAALKGAQDAGDAARKQLAETQHDLRRALATIESMRMKMVQAGLSVAAYAPAATAAAAATAAVGTESQHL